MSERIVYLDGLRGVAILMVFFFHAFSRWEGLMPYGDAYKNWFAFGWLGVQLFFLISGFVILMSLERSGGFKNFFVKRWLRLFPAMGLVSLFVYITSFYFYERPNGIAKAIDLVPGLIFVEPSWINKLLGTQVASLEGAFWSLYVEFKFYLIAGVTYYLWGRLGFVLVMSLIAGLVFVQNGLGGVPDSGFLFYADKIKSGLSFQYFSWFLAGSAVYLYQTTKQRRWMFLACVAILASLNVTSINSFEVAVAAVLVGLIFLMSKIGFISKFLEARFLVFFGYVSYPLYLCHEGFLVSMVNKLSKLGFQVPNYLYPVFVLIALSFFSYLIAKYLEPHLNTVFRNLFYCFDKFFGRVKLGCPSKVL